MAVAAVELVILLAVTVVRYQSIVVQMGEMLIISVTDVQRSVLGILLNAMLLHNRKKI
jgi:hypothetical protein